MVLSNRHKFRVDADVVKRAMVEQGYSGRSLAAEIGCNRFSLSRALNGKERSRITSMLPEIARVLGLEIKDFVKVVDPPPASDPAVDQGAYRHG